MCQRMHAQAATHAAHEMMHMQADQRRGVQLKRRARMQCDQAEASDLKPAALTWTELRLALSPSTPLPGTLHTHPEEDVASLTSTLWSEAQQPPLMRRRPDVSNRTAGALQHGYTPWFCRERERRGGTGGKGARRLRVTLEDQGHPTNAAGSSRIEERERERAREGGRER